MKSAIQLFVAIATALAASGLANAGEVVPLKYSTPAPKEDAVNERGKVVNGLSLTLAYILPQGAQGEPNTVQNSPAILGRHAYYGTRFKVRLANVGKVALKLDNFVLRDGLSVRLQGEDGQFTPQHKWHSIRKRTPIRQFLYLKPGESVEAEELRVWGRVERPSKAGRYHLWVTATTKLEGAEALKDDPKKADLHAAIWTGSLASNPLELQLPAAPKEITDAKGRRIAAQFANENLAKMKLKAANGSELPPPAVTPKMCGGMGYEHDLRQFYFALPAKYGKQVRIKMFFDGSHPSISLE